MAQPTHTKVRPSRGDHATFTKAFLQLMAGVSRREGWRESEAFHKWLDAACACLLKAVVPTDEVEARYMAVVASCKHPSETMGDFAQALAVVVDALEANRADFLGPIYSELSANAAAGQFFTPWDVCMLMARMQLPDPAALLAEVRRGGRSHIEGQEPAVGSGAMVLASSEVLREAGLEPAFSATWSCIDVDWRCVCSCYIQLTLCGVNAVVYHGNALSLETWAALPTLTYKLHPPMRRSTPAPTAQLETPFESVASVPLPAAAEPPITPPSQLAFDF